MPLDEFPSFALDARPATGGLCCFWGLVSFQNELNKPANQFAGRESSL